MGRSLLLAAVFAVAGAGSGSVSTSAAEGSAVVDAADALNLRAEPGTWAAVVSRVNPAEALGVLAGPTPDGWYQVQYGGLTGWAYGEYLRFDGAPGWGTIDAAGIPAPTVLGWGAVDPATGTGFVAEAPPDPTLGVGGMANSSWVNQNDLKVLAAPDDQSAVVDLFGAGAAVSVTGGQVGGFVPIQHWSGEAWVWSGALGQGAPAGSERWADVSRSTQSVTLYQGDQAVATYWGAMGIDGSDAGFFATANGSYRVYEKYADLSWTSYGNAWVTDWVAFDPNRLNGFHSYSMDWAGQVIPGGDGPTGGCIALAPGAADHLFSFLEVGSRVEVHW